MTFGDLPNEILDLALGETYEGGAYTLRDELSTLQEPIVQTNFYHLPGSGKATDLLGLIVYTETYVGVVMEGVFGDLSVIALKRNP